MKTRQAPGLTEAEAKAEAEATAKGIPIHEEDFISDELSEQIGKEIWIHKPTGRPYFPDHQLSRVFARAPHLEHDDPFLQFLRGEIEL